MSKDILQITFSKRKLPKTKFGRWFYWKLKFQVWDIWRPRFLAWFFSGLSTFIYWIVSKEVKEKWDKEFEEIEVHIIDETKKE